MADLDRYAQLGQAAIPGGEGPSGKPTSELDAYETIREHTNRDGRPGEPPDWEKVVELATEILASQSKDFATATYLTVGLLRTDGPAGLAAGLGVLEDMVGAHWETGFPAVARMRGRANAFAWLAERATAALENLEVQGSHKAAMLAALQHSQSLVKLLDERMGDADPQLSTLVRALKDICERIAADEPEPAPAAAPPADGAPTQAGAATPAAPAAPRPAPAAAATGGALESKSDALQWLLKLSSFYREQEPTNPLAYRLLRMARWSSIQALPPPGAEGRTEMIGPPPERVAALRQLSQAGDWPKLLEAAEAAFRERPLWLDAQRYSAQALEALGASYGPILTVVLGDLRELLGRIAGLPDLVFKDGTKSADEGTREWLAEVLSAGDAGGAASSTPRTSAAVAAADPAVAEAHQRGLELAKKGDIGQAMQLRSEASRGDDSLRGRFLMRLDWCRYCMNASREQIALPLLRALDTELAAHDLERWEPELAFDVLSLLFRCHRRLTEQKGANVDEHRQGAEHAFARLCQIDPIAAAALQ